MVRRLVDVMAHDLGVPRRASDDPDGEALACRCTFTALRFWMQAYCIDDGYGGAAGIAQTAVEQKSLAWINERPVSAAAKQVYASPDSPILLSFDSYWRSGGNQRGHVAVHQAT